MRENVFVRFHDHVEQDGVMDYCVEMSIPGRCDITLIGASQEELSDKLLASFNELFTMLGIPKSVVRKVVVSEPEPEAIIVEGEVLTNEDDDSATRSGFVSIGKLKVQAEVYRDGRVIS